MDGIRDYRYFIDEGKMFIDGWFRSIDWWMNGQIDRLWWKLWQLFNVKCPYTLWQKLSESQNYRVQTYNPFICICVGSFVHLCIHECVNVWMYECMIYYIISIDITRQTSTSCFARENSIRKKTSGKKNKILPTKVAICNSKHHFLQGPKRWRANP